MPKYEIVDGRVPLSDMKDWIQVLSQGDNPFTQNEIDGFFKSHLIVAIEKLCYGLTEDQCNDAILKEVKSKNNKPNEKGVEYLKSVVNFYYNNKNE
jgi:hypothetical protein